MNNIDKTMTTKNESEEVVTQENDTDKTENDEQKQDTSEEVEVDDEKESLKEKLKTMEAQKNHWRDKATKKSSSDEKDEDDDTEDSTSTKITIKDQQALLRNNVHEDDIDEVVEYAAFKKISVSEALKSDVIKTTLSNKAEFRKTAETSNTSSAKKGASKVSDDTLVSKLSKGEVPEKGSEEAERLFWAKRGGKR